MCITISVHACVQHPVRPAVLRTVWLNVHICNRRRENEHKKHCNLCCRDCSRIFIHSMQSMHRRQPYLKRSGPVSAPHAGLHHPVEAEHIGRGASLPHSLKKTHNPAKSVEGGAQNKIRGQPIDVLRRFVHLVGKILPVSFASSRRAGCKHENREKKNIEAIRCRRLSCVVKPTAVQR